MWDDERIQLCITSIKTCTWLVELLTLSPAWSNRHIFIKRFLLHHLTLVTLLYQAIIYKTNDKMYFKSYIKLQYAWNCYAKNEFVLNKFVIKGYNCWWQTQLRWNYWCKNVGTIFGFYWRFCSCAEPVYKVTIQIDVFARNAEMCLVVRRATNTLTGFIPIYGNICCLQGQLCGFDQIG